MGLNAPFHYVLPGSLNDPVFHTASQDRSSDHNHGASWSSIPSDTDPEDVQELKRIPCLWAFTEKQRGDLEVALQSYQHSIPGFLLPSALALGRYLTGYMEDFQDHQAVLHTATYRPQQSPEHPELVLAICANGALTRYERQTGTKLFRASKTIIEIEWARRYRAVPDRGRSPGEVQIDCGSKYRILRIAQAALLLSTFAVLEGKAGIVREAASLHAILVEYVRDHVASTPFEADEITWQAWIFEESARRTQGAIFNILNMYTMALDTAAALPSTIFKAILPSSTLEWKAGNESDWMDAQRLVPSPVAFQEAYSALFETSAPHTHLHSPLGNLILINAILQRIHLARQLQLDGSSEALRASDLNEIEAALDRWTHAWKQAPESILDPRNPDASNCFTCTSYLGLAYVRLHSTYGARRRLSDGEPKFTGAALLNAPCPQRTARIEPALLHAAQAFAIPVKFGIEYLGRKQFHHWDIQNFIWHLEAASFLSKWLSNVAETYHYEALSGEHLILQISGVGLTQSVEFESKLISVVNNLVEKAEESIEPDLLFDPDWSRHQTTINIAASLSRRIARLWACLYNKHNAPWGLVDMIGDSLAEYARLAAG